MMSGKESLSHIRTHTALASVRAVRQALGQRRAVRMTASPREPGQEITCVRLAMMASCSGCRLRVIFFLIARNKDPCA
jgi:hypothetical protein